MPRKTLQLGRPTALPSAPDEAVLDRVPNPHPGTNYVARFTFPEFTVLCPVTGQPDFAIIVIDYVPQRFLVESKSLKLYLNSFRNHSGFHEDCTVSIGKRLAGFAQTALAADRRLFPSPRRHADRCVLAERAPARGNLGAGAGRARISRAGIAHDPEKLQTFRTEIMRKIKENCCTGHPTQLFASGSMRTIAVPSRT